MRVHFHVAKAPPPSGRTRDRGVSTVDILVIRNIVASLVASSTAPQPPNLTQPPQPSVHSYY